MLLLLQAYNYRNSLNRKQVSKKSKNNIFCKRRSQVKLNWKQEIEKRVLLFIWEYFR